MFLSEVAKNIKSEYDYNIEQDVEYCFANIIYRILNLLESNCNEYIEERKKFLDDFSNLIELEGESKEILVRGFVNYYCDIENEKEALNVVNDFINKYPNSSSAIVTKSNIYSQTNNPKYEEAINIIKNALKNEKIDNNHLLLCKLAMLYDKFGDKDKAKEYQELAQKLEDEDLPF